MAKGTWSRDGAALDGGRPTRQAWLLAGKGHAHPGPGRSWFVESKALLPGRSGRELWVTAVLWKGIGPFPMGTEGVQALRKAIGVGKAPRSAV